MKQQIPINTTKEGIAPCVPSHYYKAGFRDFMPKLNPLHIPHLAILEIDEVALRRKEIEMDEFKGISIDPLARKMEFFHGNQRGFDRISHDLSPAIAAIGPNVAWFEQKEGTEMQEDPKVRCIASCRPERSWQGSVKNQDRIYDPDGISPALHCCGGGNLEPKIMQTDGSEPNSDNAVMLKYRIRKLCPIETGRLMGLTDEDFYKMADAKISQVLKSGEIKYKPMPRTALYRLHGNSIVVDVLYYIFHQMFIAEPPKPKPIQKSLFDTL